MTGWPTRLLLALVGFAAPAGALAQDTSAAKVAAPVRMYLTNDPRPGSKAPAFSLPFVTAEGPGQRGQVFDLQAELGRVVVLAFCPEAADSATQALLRAFATRRDSLFVGDVVVAAVSPSPGHELATMASQMALPFKLLPDTGGDVRRLFGVEKGAVSVYVVGIDGRVFWRELGFSPFLATSYGRLRDAVVEAGKF